MKRSSDGMDFKLLFIVALPPHTSLPFEGRWAAVRRLGGMVCDAITEFLCKIATFPPFSYGLRRDSSPQGEPLKVYDKLQFEFDKNGKKGCVIKSCGV